MLKLQFKDQRQAPVWLVETVTGLGSDPGNHIVIRDEGVEPRHAEIHKQGDALYLSDLGSRLGTQVNGQPIKQHFQLRAGDSIRLGPVELQILAPKAGTGNNAPRPRSEWSLMALSGPLKGKSFPVHGSMVFGRSSTCDIVIQDAHMSRRHAEISLKNGVLRIVDLQSSNGTCVNGKTVGEQVLKPGDKIGFDHLSFLVAGPLGSESPPPEEEDDDEATVFRAAPIPRAPRPQPRSQPVASASSAPEERVSAAPAAGARRWPWVLLVVGAMLALAGGVAAFLLR
ncbi:MAG: FHA domain-containing protein [Pseudomonadota bacterium]|nr:FHA domain-containing protein [Pseudomonadales bacterium]MDY6921059.1 FHA domain-containing protein [Pseudomonadota bacterium]